MDELTKSVILAAINPPTSAIENWRYAKEISPIFDWPDQCARLLPAIYLNLANENDPEITGLAKGVYRQCWSKNVRALESAAKFASALSRAGVEYRIIKGGALVLLHEKYGVRRMGDIDWVIPRSASQKVVEILNQIGFSPRYVTRDVRKSEIWDDAAGNCFDIHLISKGSWLNTAFSDLQVVTSFGADFQLPGYESLAVIAAKHSLIGGSRSDLAQGLVDVAQIWNKCKVSKIESELTRFGLNRDSRSFFNLLAELKSETRRDSVTYSQAIIDSFNRLKFKLLASRSWHRRLINPINLNSLIDRRSPLRSISHAVWVFFAALAPLERIFCRRFRGFMPILEVSERHSAILKFDGSGASSSNPEVSTRTMMQNELRIACQKPHGVKADLRMQVKLEKKTPRRIFINGVGEGHFTPRFSDSIAIALPESASQIEVSLRDFSFENRAWEGEMKFEVEVVRR